MGLAKQMQGEAYKIKLNYARKAGKRLFIVSPYVKTKTGGEVLDAERVRPFTGAAETEAYIKQLIEELTAPGGDKMGMYFIDERHRANYKAMRERWPNAAQDPEYQAGCYITAVPMIYDRVRGLLDGQASPVSWAFEYEDSRERGRLAPFHVTVGMAELGRLALNLWNGYDGFNLMDALGCLDHYNKQVLKCAVNVRLGEHKGQ